MIIRQRVYIVGTRYFLNLFFQFLAFENVPFFLSLSLLVYPFVLPVAVIPMHFEKKIIKMS